jgi:hypothetical protein
MAALDSVLRPFFSWFFLSQKERHHVSLKDVPILGQAALARLHTLAHNTDEVLEWFLDDVLDRAICECEIRGCDPHLSLPDEVVRPVLGADGVSYAHALIKDKRNQVFKPYGVVLRGLRSAIRASFMQRMYYRELLYTHFGVDNDADLLMVMDAFKRDVSESPIVTSSVPSVPSTKEHKVKE